MSKMFDPVSLKEILPAFRNSDSLAISYLIDELANQF